MPHNTKEARMSNARINGAKKLAVSLRRNARYGTLSIPFRCDS